MSKELEALERIDTKNYLTEREHREFYLVVEQALLNAEKEHKVLEIIKEKNIDVFRFKKLDFNTFNQLQKSCKLPELTEEEFNLLKEVLDNVGN